MGNVVGWVDEVVVVVVRLCNHKMWGGKGFGSKYLKPSCYGSVSGTLWNSDGGQCIGVGWWCVRGCGGCAIVTHKVGGGGGLGQKHWNQASGSISGCNRAAGGGDGCRDITAPTSHANLESGDGEWGSMVGEHAWVDLWMGKHMVINHNVRIWWETLTTRRLVHSQTWHFILAQCPTPTHTKPRKNFSTCSKLWISRSLSLLSFIAETSLSQGQMARSEKSSCRFGVSRWMCFS